MKDLMNSLTIVIGTVLLLAFVVLVAIASIVFYWLIASWFVDSILKVDPLDTMNILLKLFSFSLIAALFKALNGLASLSKRKDK